MKTSLKKCQSGFGDKKYPKLWTFYEALLNPLFKKNWKKNMAQPWLCLEEAISKIQEEGKEGISQTSNQDSNVHHYATTTMLHSGVGMFCLIRSPCASGCHYTWRWSQCWISSSLRWAATWGSLQTQRALKSPFLSVLLHRRWVHWMSSHEQPLPR